MMEIFVRGLCIVRVRLNVVNGGEVEGWEGAIRTTQTKKDQLSGVQFLLRA